MGELAEELRRRDFTINALTMDLDGTIFDPLEGAADVKEGVLRPCSEQTFTRDPLRIFRAFRFETDGWQSSPEMAELIRRDDWSAAFGAMPVERFSKEMLKAMALKRPEHFFQRMIEFNVGAEFLPELFRMPYIPAGPLQHHPEGDLFSHAVQALQRVAEMTTDPLARFCAFFHDLGKLATDPEQYPRHHGHEDTGFRMATEFCTRLRLPSTYRTALAWVSRLHGKANKWDELRDATKVTMAEQALKGGIAGILPMVAAADKPGGLPMAGWDAAVRIAGMSAMELGIDQKRLEALPAETRKPLILQKRAEAFRAAFALTQGTAEQITS
jgi:tRNA nucleotidyltransferase (CCA-adding enzyme)